MERNAENGKRVPLLVLGELPAALPGVEILSLSAAAKITDINEYYVVIALPSAELSSALDTLEAAGLGSDQVIVFVRGEALPRDRRIPSCGVLDQLDGETGEEFRTRLMGRLEAQRQKKLLTIFREAQDAGISRRYGEAELARVLDAARLAHALACGYGLPPSAHSRVLRDCLESPATIVAWSGEPPTERLIADAAFMLVDAFSRGLSCREVIRERAGGLSFRSRNDLLHQVDACLGSLLGGKHAA